MTYCKPYYPSGQCKTLLLAGEFLHELFYDGIEWRQSAPSSINSSKEIRMDEKFGYYIFGGLVIGALLGLLWAGNGNSLLGLGIGAFAGAGIGWFAAAAAMEKEKEKKAGK